MSGGVGEALGFTLNTFVTLATLGQVNLGTLLTPQIPGFSGPRLDDLNVQSSTYGKSIPLIYGSQNRVAGNLIWSTGLIETAKKKKSGGKGGGGSQSQTTYSYRCSAAIALSGRECSRIQKVWANSKLIWEAGVSAYTTTNLDAFGAVMYSRAGKSLKFSSLRFYPGNFVQPIDSVIEAYEGVGETPAYLGTCYIVFEDLQLADFGNQLPNITVELVADESVTVREIVQDIASRADVDAIATFMSDEVLGYAVTNGSSCVEALEPLFMSHDFALVEQYGQVRAERRAYTIHATIPLDDMAAQAGDGPQDYLKFTRAADTDLPRVVTVSYPDPAFDYQTVSQQVQRSERDSEQKIDIEIPVVITAQEAKRIADRALWQAWAEGQAVQFSVTDKWARLQTGKIVAVNIAGEYQPMRILEITRGENGVTEIKAAKEDTLAFTTAQTAQDVIANNPVRAYDDTDIVLIDTTMLRAADDNNGFYWGATSPGLWQGGVILRSTDGGVNYNTVSPVGVRAGIGDVATALPSGPTNVWDYANTLRVTMRYPSETLESATELDVLNGANVAWLGNADGNDGEILQFMTATLVSQGVYDLTGLLRGRLATDHAIGSHANNEVFVLLDQTSIGQSDFGTGDWDIERQYKGISVDQDPAAVTAQDFTNTGERKRPRSGVNPIGTRDGSNNLTITWTPRTRIPYTGLSAGVPIGEAFEAYEVDVYDGVTIVRTISTTTPSASYTAAEQTADGLTPGDDVTIAIYQMSETRGRGRVRSAVV